MIYIDLFPHTCFCFFTMGEVSKTFTTAAMKKSHYINCKMPVILKLHKFPQALACEDTDITNEFYYLNFVIRACTLTVVWAHVAFSFCWGWRSEKADYHQRWEVKKKKETYQKKPQADGR